MALRYDVSLADLGKKLREMVDKSANKEALLRILRTLSTALTQVDQSAPEDVVKDMDHCKKALVRKELIDHRDKEVKLLVATCASEIMRIEAPTVPYDDQNLKMLFELIVGTFRSLDDLKSPSYSKTVGILETFASVKSCILMLDLEVDPGGELLHNMFKVFFRKARNEHPPNVIRTMVEIMSLVINEGDEFPPPVLVTEVLSNLIKKSAKESATAAAHDMAAEIVRNTADKLAKHVLVTLTKIREGETVPTNLADHYHDIIFEVYRCAPQLLSTFTPNIKQDLMDVEPDKRLKMLRLLGKIFSETNEPTPKEFRELLPDYAGRFIDSSVKVRLGAIDSAKDFMLMNESLGSDANVIMDELAKRLLDSDDGCRTEAVNLICDMAMNNLKSVPKDVLESVTIRLRDNKSTVRAVTMQKIVNLYASYCKNTSADIIPNELDWIPVKVLKAVSDRLFRSKVQGVEIVLCEELFPASLSVEERSKRWMGMFCHLERMDLKNLERILHSKQRFQNELQAYLLVRQKLKDEEPNSELEKKVQSHIKAMAMTFPDHVKAEENLEKLHQMKDKAVFKKLSILLNPSTTYADARATCNQLMDTVGTKHPQFDFIKSVAVKSSYLLFGKENIACVSRTVQSLSSKDALSAGMSLLVLFAGYFPSLFEGLESEILQMLNEKKDNSVKEKALHILALTGQHLRNKIVESESSLDLMLEKFCLEGTRKQAKYAVSAIAALSSDSGLKALSILYGHLLSTLSVSGPLPTVLQSLGCIAQTAKSVYETREKDVLQFILNDLLVREPAESTSDEWEGQSKECRLKEYALKTLTRSYVPIKDISLRQSSLVEFLPSLMKFLKFGSISETPTNSSDADRGHLRLAAAKAVLRLSQAWDKVMPVEVFRDTLFTIQDPVFQVRKHLLSKTHQYIKAQRLPHKYVCIFPLASIDADKEISQEAKRYMADAVETIRREAERFSEAQHPECFPEYVLTYLVHVLAHHPKFPSSPDAKAAAYEPFYRYLNSYLSALLSDGRKEERSLAAIYQILRSIKRTNDATVPSNSKSIHILCDIGLYIAKDLVSKSPESVESSVRLPTALYIMTEDSEKSDGSDLPSCLTEAALNGFRSSEPRKRGKKPEDSDEDDEHPPAKSRRVEGEKSVSKQKARKGSKDGEEALSEEVEEGPQQKRKRGRPAKEKPEKQDKPEVNGEETPVVPKKRGRPKGSSAKKLKVETESPSAEAKDETPSAKQEHADDKKVDSVKKSEKQERAEATSPVKRRKVKLPVPEEDDEDENEQDAEPYPSVGRRVKVWWPDDKKFYPGKVDGYNPQTKEHIIAYDDGDEEKLIMVKERWHFIYNNNKSRSQSPPPSRGKSKKKVKEEERQGSSQKTKSSGKKSAKKKDKDKDASEEVQHHSDNERGGRARKANGSNKTVNGGAAVEVESSQPAASVDVTEHNNNNNTDDDEPLQTYRVRLKKIK